MQWPNTTKPMTPELKHFVEYMKKLLQECENDLAKGRREAQTNIAGWNLANEQMLAKLKKLEDFIESERQGANLPSDIIEAAILIMRERGKQVERLANTRTPITSLIGKETILNHFWILDRKEALCQLAAIIDGPIGDKLTGEEMAQSELYNALQWIEDEIGD